jgi:hypothetical protein
MANRDPSQQPFSDRRQDLLKAAVVSAASLVLYVITRTRHFGGDDTVFALVVQRWLEVGEVERVFVHPHHLLYNPLVAACSWMVRAVSGGVFVLDVGAAVSASAAAAAVAGTYLVLRRFRVDENIALLASLILALSGGMWRYATRMEVYTLAAAGVVAWLAAMSNPVASWRRLAAGFAAPWLCHSVLGLLVLPGAWLQRRRPRVLGLALATGLVAPGVAVVGLLAWLNGARSASAVVDIVVGPGSGRWLSPPNPLAMLRALGGLATLQTYHALPVFSQPTMALFDLLGLFAIVTLAALVAWGAVVSIRDNNAIGLTSVLGIGCLVPLWLVWDVGNPEHAVAATPLFTVLIAVAASAVGRKGGSVALAATAAVLLVVNGVGSILLQTQPQLSRTLLVSDFVRETIPEQGTLVAFGVDPELRLALPYLGGRRVIDLTLLVHSARRAGATPEEALRRWLQLARFANGTWLLEDPDAPAVRQWIAGLGIPEQTWRQARAMIGLGRGVTLEADGTVLRDPITLRRLEVRGNENPRD